MTTTATPADIKAVCDSWAGRHEEPVNSNHIFIWDELHDHGYPDMNGCPYCAGGIVLEDIKAGAPVLAVQSPFYCPSRVQYYRAHGLFVAGHGNIDPADEIFYAWTPEAIAAGLAEHVERDIRPPGTANVKTFGCNTSSGDAGSQANGDGCYYRVRPLDATIIGVGKYSKLLDHHEHRANPVKRNPYLPALTQDRLPIKVGDHGDEVRGVQWAVGVGVDGVFGPQTRRGVEVFQRYHRDRNGRPLYVDGVVGKLTLWAVRQITHHQHS